MIEKKKEYGRRLVILQTQTQVTHYKKNRRQNDDLIIPIGPEAMFHAEENGWEACCLGDLWSQEEYRQAREESWDRIGHLIDTLDEYSKHQHLGIGLELGRYYAFQLWIIIGQIHYNYFIVYTIAKCLRPTSILAYTKDVAQPFLEIRPDPDCIFTDVLLRSGCFKTEQIEIQRIHEKQKNNTFREKIVNALPRKLLVRLREIRDRRRIKNSGKSLYRLLLIGGGYDWFKVLREERFRDVFSVHILSSPLTSYSVAPDNELLDILREAVNFEGSVAYGFKDIAMSIQADMLFFSKIAGKIENKLKDFDAVVTAALTYPRDSFLAHMAARVDSPVIVWQHGEKGQSEDRTSLYTELFYATDYLAYAPAVQRQYRSWIGRNNLVNVETVGNIGKCVTWFGGKSIVYATGKWFKTAVPFKFEPDPDGRQYAAHKIILDYLNGVAVERPVIFKANNTPRLNVIPYQYENICVDYVTPFVRLLETASIVILDTPATTLVEACSTQVPIFVLGGRTEYHPEFLEVIRRRVVWCETPGDLVLKIALYIADGIYNADVNDDTFYREYCGSSGRNDVVGRVKKTVLQAIKRNRNT